VNIVANAFIWGAAYAAIALGFALIYKTSRFFHFAHAAVMGAGGYAGAFVLAQWNWPWWLAVVIGGGFAALIGILLDTAVYRPIRARGASDLVMFIASMGLLVLGQNGLSMAFGDAPLRVTASNLSLEVMGITLQRHRIVLLIGSTIATAGLLSLDMLTPFGRSTRAVADDPVLARGFGVPVARVRSQAFSIGSAVGGAVMVLMAPDIDLTPGRGLQVFFVVVVVTVVGSSMQPLRIVLAAFGVALLIGTTGRWLPGQWQEAAVFLVLLAVLTVRSITRTLQVTPGGR
jgi:branched-chain amino acid transport system permease protein